MRLNEKNVFLLDGMGAVASATSTGVVLPLFSESTRVSAELSSILGVVGGVFAVYSLSCYFLAGRIRPPMLAAIMAANCGYCLASLGIAAAWPGLASLGRAYFVVEAMIVGVVVAIEWSVYRRAFLKSQ